MRALLYNVRVRLIIVTTSVIIVIAIALSSLLYGYTETFLQKKMGQLTMENLSQYSMNLRHILRETYETAMKYATNDDLLKEVEKISVASMDDKEVMEELHKQLRDEVAKYPYIYSIYVYIEAKDVVITSSPLRKYQNVDREDVRPWVHVDGKSGSNLLSLVEYEDTVGMFDNYFYAVRRELRLGDEILGVLAVNIDAQKLYNDILSNMMYEEESEIMLVNGQGSIISHSNRRMIGKEVIYVKGMSTVMANKNGYYTTVIDGRKMLVVFITASYSNYKLVYRIPLQTLSDGISYLKIFSVVLSMVSILFGAVFIWIFSKHIYKPIRTIKEAMLTFGQGDFQTRIQSIRKDEFQVLYSGFNDMADELTELIHETIEQKLKIKEEQFKALQHQISPHFIYNTLNSIKCSAVIERDVKTIEMLDAFIQLLELSVHERDMMTLKEEIQQVENYILLQKHRYGELFDVEIMMDTDVQHYLVPKLILQPLVENSIYHGINLREGNGLIFIKCYRAGNDLIIQVYDNGVNADIRKLEKRLRNKEKTRFNGIGIHNINERIQLIYGSGYGLTYKKEEGGLKAILRLKCQEEKFIVLNKRGDF